MVYESLHHNLADYQYKLFFPSSSGCFVFVCDSSFKFSKVYLSVRFDVPLRKATDSECHGMNFCLLERITRLLGSSKHVPSSVLTAKFAFMSNQTRFFKSPRRRCNSMSSFNGSGYFVAVRSAGSLFRFIPFSIHRLL